MQPYLFPYIGYFQLIHAVDAFVIHDDIQYIKGGWINRNRIQINNKDYLFTFTLLLFYVFKKLPPFDYSDEFMMGLKNNTKSKLLLDEFDRGYEVIQKNGI